MKGETTCFSLTTIVNRCHFEVKAMYTYYEGTISKWLCSFGYVIIGNYSRILLWNFIKKGCSAVLTIPKYVS